MAAVISSTSNTMKIAARTPPSLAKHERLDQSRLGGGREHLKPENGKHEGHQNAQAEGLLSVAYRR
jgi:hypothetical protein